MTQGPVFLEAAAVVETGRSGGWSLNRSVVAQRPPRQHGSQALICELVMANEVKFLVLFSTEVCGEEVKLGEVQC